MPAINRKERDKLLRKTDMINAAVRVFATKGYHKATMSDIAKESQYAVGTLYLYFKDKKSMYLALIEKKIEELVSTVQNKVDRTRDIKEKLKVLVEEQLSFFEDNQDFFQIYFSEREGLHWTIKDKISKPAVDRFMKYLDYIASLIKKAQEKNLIRNDVEPQKFAYILASMLNAVICPWLKKKLPKKESLKDMSGFVLDVFLNGTGQRR